MTDSTSMKLYTATICPFAHRAMIVALHKGFKGEVIQMSLASDLPDWYVKDVNPRAEVPTLQLPNGGPCLSESLLIAQYLDEALEPRNSLFPTNAEVRRQIRAFTKGSEAAMWSLYGVLTAKPEELPAKITNCREEWRKVVAAMSTTSDFAVGSTFTMADVLLCPFVIRFTHTLKAYCGFDLAAEFPRLRAFRDQCLTIPAVAKSSPAPEYFISGYTHYAEGKRADGWRYTLTRAANCPFSERVEYVWAYVTEGPKAPEYMKGKKGAYMAVETVADLSKAESVPSLQLPTNGAVIAASVDAATYLAEQYPEAGLLPATAEGVFAGRWYADTCGNVFDSLIGFVLAKHKDFDIDSDVAKELARCEALFKTSSGGCGPFLLGGDVSLYDLLTLPVFHRLVILGEAKLAAIAPSIVASVKAARADAFLGKLLISEEAFMSA